MSPKIDTSYLKDHAQTRGFMLGRPVRPKLTPDGNTVLFLRAKPRAASLTLWEMDVASGRTREVLTPRSLLAGAEETVSAEEKARRERQRISVGGFTDFQLTDDGEHVLVVLSGQWYLAARAARGAVRKLPVPVGALDARFSPDGKTLAFVHRHDLWVLDLDSAEARQLTDGGSELVTHGLAEFVAQEEMGRMSGYWWAPDSRSLAYEEADARGVESWWVADPARPGQPPHHQSYPRPGHANVRVRIGVIGVEGGATTWVELDERRWEYVTQVRWEAGGPLTLAVQTRDQREVALLAVQEDGSTKSLGNEKDPAWMPVKRDVPRWVGAREGFVWWREVNGERRLELRGPDGDVRKVLHKQRGGPLEVLDVDRANGWVYFRTGADPRVTDVARVRLTGGGVERLTSRTGVHSATVARSGERVVIESLWPDAMPSAAVHAADGTMIRKLPAVAEEPPFHPRAELTRTATEWKDAAGGYYAVVVRPRNFDPRRKYPVLVDVYGGPGHCKVTAAMNTRLIPQWLADRGFIVVSLDNRGTPGRDRAWERPLFGKCGSVPLSDQIAGLKALGKSHPEMDLTRAGIVGWSYGGYMSALAVLERPDVFRAAVAGAPVVDWMDYDTHYTERYMGLPARNAKAYREASLLERASELKRPLLIVHGTADDNVFFVHALKLADALFRAGQPFEMLPLAGLTHMVPEPVVMQRLWGRIAEHFVRHLGGPSEPRAMRRRKR